MRQSAVQSYSKEEWELDMLRAVVTVILSKVNRISMKMWLDQQTWISQLLPLYNRSQKSFRSRSFLWKKRWSQKRKNALRWWASMNSYNQNMRFCTRSMIRYQIPILKQRRSCKNWSRKIKNWLRSWKRRNRKLLRLRDTKMSFMKRWRKKKKKLRNKSQELSRCSKKKKRLSNSSIKNLIRNKK